LAARQYAFMRRSRSGARGPWIVMEVVPFPNESKLRRAASVAPRRRPTALNFLDREQGLLMALAG
jgi:hypothetical protein